MSLIQSGVYAILNLRDQRAYIGRSANIARRWSEHRCALNKGTHSAVELQAAWKAHGSTWFAFVILENVTNLDACMEREQFHLQSTLSPYNQSDCTLTGPRPGAPNAAQRPEVRAKLSAALKGRRKSALHRQHLSDAKRGIKNPAHGDKVRGRKRSAATIARMRTAHLGRTSSLASNAKRSATLTGRVFSSEWKARISHAKNGVPWSVARRNAHLDKANNSFQNKELQS